MPETPEEREKPPTPEENLVPGYDVRNCIVCGKPMQGRKCKYVCPTCGYKIDCSDAY